METLGDGRDGNALVQDALSAAAAAAADVLSLSACGEKQQYQKQDLSREQQEEKEQMGMRKEQGQSQASLLEFYKARIAEMERDREDLVRRVGSTEVPHAELHRVKWELKVRQEEVEQLQNALSDANVQIFEEREESLKLLAENDELKMQQTEDRRRIQHLLALTEPVAQEVTFFKDCRPYLMSRKLHGGNNNGGESSSIANEKGRPRGVHVNPNAKLTARSSRENTGGKVLRTIYLPNEHTDTLNQRVQALENQLEQQQRTSRDRVAALERDRADREALHKRAKEALEKQIEALEQRLKYSEQATRAATKDYLELRHHSQLESRENTERLSELEKENKIMRAQLDTLVDRVSKEMEAARQSILQDADRAVQRFRKQAMFADDQLVKVKHQKEHVSRDLRDKAMSLEDRNVVLVKKNKQLEQRRKLDHEGFLHDIASMRKSILTLERIAYSPNPSGGISPQPAFDAAAENTLAGANVLKKEIEHLRARIENLKPHLLSNTQESFAHSPPRAPVNTRQSKKPSRTTSQRPVSRQNRSRSHSSISSTSQKRANSKTSSRALPRPEWVS